MSKRGETSGQPQGVEEYALSVTPGFDTPERTVKIDGDDYDGGEFTVTAIGKVEAGEELKVYIDGVDEENESDYSLEVRDSEETVRGVAGYHQFSFSDDEPVIFDTGDMVGTREELEERTYAALLIKNGDDLKAIHPFVVSYDVTLESPALFEADETVTVTAEHEPMDVPVEKAQLVYWDDVEDDSTKTMQKIGAHTYEADISLSEGVYNLYTAVETDYYGEDDIVGISNRQEATAADTLVEEWDVSIDGGLQYARPATDGLQVYLAGLGGNEQDGGPVVSLSPDGELNWEFEREGALSDSSPVVSDGTVYVGSGSGVLYALETNLEGQEGTVEWTFPSDGTGESAITSTPAIDNGTVYVGTNGGQVHAVDASDGTNEWTKDVGGPIYGAVSAEDGHVFVATRDGQVVGLDDDGTTLLDDDLDTALGSSSPTYHDETLYIAGDAVYAIDVAASNGGDVVFEWKQDDYSGTAGSTPAVDGETVYVGGVDGVYALDDTENGDELWTYETEGAVAANPIVVEDAVVVPSLGGTVYVLDADTGELRAFKQFDTPILSSPVVEGGSVYLGIDSETVVALELTF